MRIVNLIENTPGADGLSAYVRLNPSAAMVEWLRILSGRLSGGVCYLGVGPVMCLAGRTAEGEKIVVKDSGSQRNRS